MGIERARGQRVAFLDKDWLAPTFLEKLHAALDAAPGAAAAYCDDRRAMPDATFGPVRSDPEVARAVRASTSTRMHSSRELAKTPRERILYLVTRVDGDQRITADGERSRARASAIR